MNEVGSRRTDGRRHRARRAGILVAIVVAVGIVPWVGAGTAWPFAGRGGGHDTGSADKLLFFASDGLRQDPIAKCAEEGVVPGFRKLLLGGARASGNGLLTQAPPNTGSGWFTLSTGAGPGSTGRRTTLST